MGKKIYMVIIMLSVLMLTTPPAFTDPFQKLWYDGNAEISVYDLNESRYGEMRRGKRVMVSVTEPMRLSTYIKPDVRLEASQKIDVIKLNDVLKFNTGIYDYSVMTSVFSSVDDTRDIPGLSAMKVSFSAQEWCGNVFEILKRRDNRYEGRLYSYFESDGEPVHRVPFQGRTEPEDNLWLMVRELKGPLLEAGEKLEITIIPSSWKRRKVHEPIKTYPAVISKERSGKIRTRAGRYPSNLFTWSYPGQTVRVWVEAEYPHRILKWEESDGSGGILAATSREPYWKQNRNKDLGIRKRLTLHD